MDEIAGKATAEQAEAELRIRSTVRASMSEQPAFWSTVAVIGCGGVGLSAVQGAAIAGAGRIIAIDTRASKLELAQICGATDLVNASEGDPVQQVKDLTGGGVEYSFEAIGLKLTAEQAFYMLAKGGTATVIGMIPVGTKIELHGPDFAPQVRRDLFPRFETIVFVRHANILAKKNENGRFSGCFA